MTIEQNKIMAVAEYFLEKFPGADIADKRDYSLGAQSFRIRHPAGVHFIKITWDYLSQSVGIKDDLESWDLAGFIGNHAGKTIFLNAKGPVLLEYAKTIGSRRP